MTTDTRKDFEDTLEVFSPNTLQTDQNLFETLYHQLSDILDISCLYTIMPLLFQKLNVTRRTLIPEGEFIHSFSSLSYDRSKASPKASSPHSAIQSFLLQMRVSSPFLKDIQ
jgi:hypothetical protein